MTTCLKIDMSAGGCASYSPQRAPEGSAWGPYEVHPQKVARVVDGTSELAHNGEWIVSAPSDKPIFVGGIPLRYLAFPKDKGGRKYAELFAVAQNREHAEGAPTRVVDLTGAESASRYTPEMVLQHAQLLLEQTR